MQGEVIMWIAIWSCMREVMVMIWSWLALRYHPLSSLLLDPLLCDAKNWGLMDVQEGWLW